MLRRHLIETDLQGAQGMVGQARTIIDETQDLLTQAESDTRDEEDDRFTAIRDTEGDLNQLDDFLGGVSNDLQELYTKIPSSSGGVSQIIANVEEKAEKAEAVASRAHDRIARYNDTRNEEEARFLQIEDNLGGIEDLQDTLPWFTASWVLKLRTPSVGGNSSSVSDIDGFLLRRSIELDRDDVVIESSVSGGRGVSSGFVATARDW